MPIHALTCLSIKKNCGRILYFFVELSVRGGIGAKKSNRDIIKNVKIQEGIHSKGIGDQCEHFDELVHRENISNI